MPKVNYQQRANSLYYGLSIACILIASVLLWANNQFNWQMDWTFGARNTLTKSTQDVLKQMDKPLHIEAYFDSNAQIREQVRRFVSRYQRFKKDTHLTFADTTLGTDAVDKQGFTHLGQLKIIYDGNEHIITRLSEQVFSGALLKLTRKQEVWVAVIQGHGERDPLDSGSNGISRFTEQLKQIGIQTQPLNLLNNPVIPDNTRVLMLAGARNAYLAGELEIIQNYIQKGGNVFWLREPGKQNYLKSIDTVLQLEQIAGVVIDANTKLRAVLGIKHPAVVPVVQYKTHPITDGLATHSLFPFATALIPLDESDWQSTVLFTSLDRSWAEVGSLNNEELTYEENKGDTRGPLNLGLALRRNIDKIEQRIVIVGDSDFIANGYLGNGANLKLGLNIINWLTQDEHLMSITPHAAPDQTLELSDNNIIFVAALLLVVIPTMLIATGFIIRWLRYRN